MERKRAQAMFDVILTGLSALLEGDVLIQGKSGSIRIALLERQKRLSHILNFEDMADFPPFIVWLNETASR